MLGFKARKAGFRSRVVVGPAESQRQRPGAGQCAETQVGPRSLPSVELPALLENRHGHTCPMQGAFQGSTDEGCLTHCRG